MIETYDFRHASRTIPRAIAEEVKAAIPGPPALLAATPCREAILEKLTREHGWSDEVKLSPDSKITISSCKEQIGLCVQTGNMARFYADVMKLSLLHAEERIYAALLVLPCQDLASAWSDNIANYERLRKELPIFSTIVHVPILVYGLKKP